MGLLLIGALLGGMISLLIAHSYYRKSKSNVPDWAEPLIERLPQIAPREEELISIFQDLINEGKITPHPVFQYVACPKCKGPLEDLKETVSGDDYVDVLGIECPHCGYDEWRGL
jgi:hypothetical protein